MRKAAPENNLREVWPAGLRAAAGDAVHNAWNCVVTQWVNRRANDGTAECFT